MENKELKREANIDLLRIIAMFMVITLHCLGYSQITSTKEIEIYNMLIARFLDSFTLCANVIFILISGYYLINKKLNLKKILCLWGKTVLYSVMFFIIFTALGKNPPIYKSFFPILSGHYWFITCYIAIYLLSPIINKVINTLTQQQVKYIIIILLIFLGIVQIIFNPANIFSGELMKMILIYIIGAYIRKYVTVKENNKYFIKSILIAIIFSIIYILLFILITACTSQIEIEEFIVHIYAQFRNFNNILLIAIGVCMFMKFKTINIKSSRVSKVLAFISSSVFSIYILHENINLRDAFWTQLGIMNFGNSWLQIPYLLFIVLCVFTVCILIDLVRRGLYNLLKKISFVNDFVNKLNQKIILVNEKINTYIE